MKHKIALVASLILVPSVCSAEELPKFIKYSARTVLGTIDPPDPNNFYVCRFFDPYRPIVPREMQPEEYRYRVYVPDGSRVNVLWQHGQMKSDELPRNGTPMFPKPLPKARGDIVIVVRATASDTPRFVISVFPEFDSSDPSIQSKHDGNAKWLPSLNFKTVHTASLPTGKITSHDGKQRFTLLRQYGIDGETMQGFAVWLEID